MRRPERVSVVVTTYNWPDALDLVLDSLAAQTWPAFEVIVADDGSRDDTGALVRDWTGRFPVPLRHVWQEDRGFRAARARNLGVLAAEGDYLVFLDGDCLCLPQFLHDHARLAEAGWFVAGRRAIMHPEGTRRVLGERLPIHRLPPDQLRRQGAAYMKKGSVRRLRPLPLGPLRKLRPRAWEGVQTCNLGVWRSDFDAVRGFDEGFTEYGLEDTDLVLRLFRLGLRCKQADHASPVLHLHHQQKTMGEGARARFDELRRSGRLTADVSALPAPGSA